MAFGNENTLTNLFSSFLCILAIIESTEAACMQEMHFYGTHYDFGYCIGQRFQAEIQNILANYSYMPRLLYWKNGLSGQQLNFYKGKGLSIYKDYGDEIRGLADGANVTEDEIYLLNLEQEIKGYNGDAPKTLAGAENTEMLYADGSVYSADSQWANNSTGVWTRLNYTILNKKRKYINLAFDITSNAFLTGDINIGMLTNAFFGHFVVLDDIFKDMVFVMNAKIIDETTGNISQQFRSVMIPGYLPGNIISYNSYGVITSINKIFETIQPVALRFPLCFTMRDIVMATSASDAVAKLTDSLSSTMGVHLNILHSGTNYSSFEFHVVNSFSSTESLVEYSGGSTGMMAHFNILQRLTGTIHQPMASLYRSSFVSKYLFTSPPTTEAEFHAMMSDTSTPIYPFYRDRNTYTDYSTMVTAIVDINNSHLNIYLGTPDGAFPNYQTSTASYGT